MIIKQSISTKIRWLFIGFTLLLSVFFGSMIMAYSWMVEDNVFNRLVADEAAYIEQVFRQQGRIQQPASRFMVLYPSWSDLPGSIQLLRSQSPDRVEFPLANGGTLHLTTLQLGQQQMILAADVSQLEVSPDYLPTVVTWLLVTVIVVCLMAFYLSVRISRIAVLPVQRLAKLVEEKAPGEVVKFAHMFADDETGYLAHTVEDSINQLQAAVTREEEFTRDVSHELRTPVTVLQMLETQWQHAGEIANNWQIDLKQAVQQIDHTVAVLLALARKESLTKENLCLLAEIEDCAINHYGLANVRDLALEVNVDARYRVAANRNLLHILLNNLFDNAINHGSNPSLAIKLAGNCLSFVNTTEQAAPSNIFNRETKGGHSQGLGLGLNLVQRICARQGWHVQAASDNAQFSLTIEFRQQEGQFTDQARSTDSLPSRK